MLNTLWAEEIKAPLLPKTVWDLEDCDKYVFIMSDGKKNITTWDDYSLTDKDRRECGNCFLTAEYADMELLRRESRAKAWMPDMDQVFWGIGRMGRAFDTTWQDDNTDMMYFHNGNVHKTEEESIEWKAKYGKAF